MDALASLLVAAGTGTWVRRRRGRRQSISSLRPPGDGVLRAHGGVRDFDEAGEADRDEEVERTKVALKADAEKLKSRLLAWTELRKCTMVLRGAGS